MSLDETSLAIGRLQAAQESTVDAVNDMKSQMSDIDHKLDKLLARDAKTRMSLKHWLIMITASSAGGGGIAHALTKFFGP
jgi:hypothetical protein